MKGRLTNHGQARRIKDSQAERTDLNMRGTASRDYGYTGTATGASTTELRPSMEESPTTSRQNDGLST